MEGDHIKNNNILLPLAWIYGFVIRCRNLLYDIGLFKSKSYNMPVINVGNLTVGGTGKTPHTEYLVNLLKGKLNVAVLSRGYKRKTKGFVLADADSSTHDIGDEPFQIKHKFPDIQVAVDKNRCNGIERLMGPDMKEPVDVIILDDAYQYRRVSPGVNILLMDYHRLIYFDKLLPAGRLREPRSNINRADIVIVTKCPNYLTPMDKRGIGRSLELERWQHLFFSTFKYGKLYPLFSSNETDKKKLAIEDLKEYTGNILVVSGIASPKQLEYDLAKITKFDSLSFSDHHQFTKKDIRKIESRYKSGIIITTEKDAARMRNLGREAFSQKVADAIYVLPVEVEFMSNTSEYFDNIITSYVQKNSRNSTLYRGVDS